jgi:outer membrane autotransporter protein
MAGPYLSARLAQNLYFTTRAAWGVSSNTVSPFGTYDDDFDTDRWLASAELTGNWNFGNWRITPSAGVTYVEENQHSYTDSRGVRVPSQTVSLGEVAFGPEIAYRYLADNGIVFEPHISMNGLWDFDSPTGGEVVGYIASDSEIRAAVKGGLMARMTGGASFRMVGTFDGIGADGFDAFGAQGWVNIPLH